MRLRASLLAGVAALAVAACGGGSGTSGGSGSGSGSSGSSASGSSGGSGSGQSAPPATTRVQVIQGIGREGGFDAQQIYRAESPGVVTVISIFGGSADLGSLLGGNGGGGGSAGEGSGIVLDGKGEIATNAHVVTSGQGAAIRRARQVYVEFADGNRVQATIVGYDPNADVALLRVPTAGLTLRPLPLGRSASVKVGEPVAAIGSPFGEQQSLSVGVVSAVDRTIDSLTNFEISGAVQTDAAINPGNSGGPLVDEHGKVIGINQQIKTQSGGGEGVGFAVPVDVVRRSLDQLRSTGHATYAFLGVATVPLYPQLVRHFGLSTGKGAWVQQVTAGGPAADAGVKGGSGNQVFQAATFATGGDVITKVQGTPVTDADSLSAVIARFKPGDTVTLEVRRGAQTKDLKVKLGDRPLGTPPQGG